MSRTGITAYDLLISCPGDVSGYVSIIKECIESFNIGIGRINNAQIDGRHWSTDSYSQSGNTPQEILNEQFVRECDAAVAIFWTRFGTPTDKYGSGTEEEIEEMMSANKQVFMYFIDAPISMSEVDVEQYKKVQAFKEKYVGRGTYAVVKNEEELRKIFTNHLTMHFLPIIMGAQNESVNIQKKSLLCIKDCSSLDSESAVVMKSSFLDSKFIKNMELKILGDIEKEEKVFLPKREIEQETDEIKKGVAETREENLIRLEDAIKKTDFFKGLTSNAEISDVWKNEILNFMKRFNRVVEESFWNVGNLTVVNSPLHPMLGGGYSLKGLEDEKNHYEAIKEIYWEIRELNEYRKYLTIIDNFKRLELVVANNGTTYDEDIDIKIIIPKGKIVKKGRLPVPDMHIIDTIMDMHFVEIAYKSQQTDVIDSYSGYPISSPKFSYRVNDPFNPPSDQEEYEESKEKYLDEIDDLFCYQFFERDDNDILMFHVNYLKHNTNMAFPTILLFSDIPEKLAYEITSKYNPEVVKGEIYIS